MPINVLFDGNNCAIRILTSMLGYGDQFKSDHQVNLFMHSFLAGVQSTCNKIKQKYGDIGNICIIWDSRLNNRKKLYPQYKGNRKPKTLTDERDKTNHYTLLDQLKDSLKLLGDWACIEQSGFEADDLIAHFVNESTIDNNFVIVSSDNDMYQLLGNRVTQYLPHRKEFYTYLDFKKEFGIIPEKYVYVKALAGDRGDNIIGINGVGIKKAVKLIQQGRCWSHWLNTYGKEVDLEMNVELIRIPFEADKIDMKMSISNFNKSAWIEIFQLYGLNKLSIADFRQLLEK